MHACVSQTNGNVRVVTLAYSILDAQNRTWALAPSGSFGASSGLIDRQALILSTYVQAFEQQQQKERAHRLLT